jgi:hypothetical protein
MILSELLEFPIFTWYHSPFYWKTSFNVYCSADEWIMSLQTFTDLKRSSFILIINNLLMVMKFPTPQVSSFPCLSISPLFF